MLLADMTTNLLYISTT